MSKKLIALSACIVLLFSTSHETLALYSPQDVIASNQLKFQQLNNKILNISTEISDLNSNIESLSSTIKSKEKEITVNSNLIHALEGDLGVLNEEIKIKQDLADKRLRAIYKSSYNKSYLSLLLTSENIVDLFSKYEAAKRISSMDKKVFDELDSRKKSLQEKVTLLEDNQKQITDLKNSNLASLEALNKEKANLQELVRKFNEEKEVAVQIIEENENKLVSHSVSVINTQKATMIELKNAISALKCLEPQLNTASIKKRVKKYIAEGTERLSLMTVNSNSSSNIADKDTYKATYTMLATAYSGHGITAMGLKPVRDPDGLSTIAVDPNIIPLGTKVYIPGYGYAICSDTGGAIKGYKIDIYLNSRSECYKWGRRNVTLHVIAYPGEW